MAETSELESRSGTSFEVTSCFSADLRGCPDRSGSSASSPHQFSGPHREPVGTAPSRCWAKAADSMGMAQNLEWHPISYEDGPPTGNLRDVPATENAAPEFPDPHEYSGRVGRLDGLAFARYVLELLLDAGRKPEALAWSAPSDGSWGRHALRNGVGCPRLGGSSTTTAGWPQTSVQNSTDPTCMRPRPGESLLLLGLLSQQVGPLAAPACSAIQTFAFPHSGSPSRNSITWNPFVRSSCSYSLRSRL